MNQPSLLRSAGHDVASLAFGLTFVAVIGALAWNYLVSLPKPTSGKTQASVAPKFTPVTTEITPIDISQDITILQESKYPSDIYTKYETYYMQKWAEFFPVPKKRAASDLERVNQVLYQGMYVLLTCKEFGIRVKHEDAGETCAKGQWKHLAEMWKIVDRLSAPGGDGIYQNECFRKARMPDFEKRYPPYAHMTIPGREAPKAYEADIFLTCVREQLAKMEPKGAE